MLICFPLAVFGRRRMHSLCHCPLLADNVVFQGNKAREVGGLKAEQLADANRVVCLLTQIGRAGEHHLIQHRDDHSNPNSHGSQAPYE
jgi:hypothetical protein